MSSCTLYKGIDIAVPLTDTECRALKNARYKFVCRYYSDYFKPRHNWKILHKSEAEKIVNADLDIVAIYELGGRSKTYSKETGKQDCLNAIYCAEQIEQPKNTTIYFAVDSPLRLQSEIENVSQYFSSINEEMNLYKKTTGTKGWKLGIYGNYYVINYMYGKHNILYYWQTTAWSQRNLFTKANFIQYNLSIPVCGIKSVDENIAFSSDLGQFRI
jgi:hypothetical protein